MKRLILLLAGLFAIFSLSACSSFESEETETSDEAYICIGIDGVSTARTIAPAFNVAELSGFSLYGRKSEQDEESSFRLKEGSYTSNEFKYEELLISSVAIETGTWYEFRLSASIDKGGAGSTYFVGTISNKEIVKGKNTLNFTLMPDTERNRNTGYVNVTFRIPSATAVKKAKAGLYKVESDECYYGYNDRPYTLKVTPSEVSDTATAVFSTRSNGTPPEPGTYRLKAWFYADEECTVLVSTFCELVKVLDGITTNAGRDIDMLNTVYTITLNEGSYKEGFTPKTIYTRFEGVTLPKEEEMQKSGYTFAGWYTNAEGTGEAVTSIPAAQAENVVLYARWLEGYWLTADTWEIYVQRGFDGLEEISIHLVGEWTENTFSNFLQKKLIFYSSSKISISLDMSQMTGITEIKTKGFGGVVSVKLPAGVTSIGDYAFHNCESLKSIELPESLTSIGECAFSGCSSLKKIDLPEGLISIGKSAFAGCAFETLTIPDSVTTIEANAFSFSSSLKSIVLPKGLKKIEENLFAFCHSLENIRWPTALVSIELDAFWKCNSLKSIELPASLVSIKVGAFVECESLKSVEFPSHSNITDIEGEAFKNCVSLESIKIPDKVKTIGEGSFSFCKALKTVNLGKITWICDEAFYGCASLSEITIPATVNRIGRKAFVDSGLKNVYFEATNVKWYHSQKSSYSGGHAATHYSYGDLGGTNSKNNAWLLTDYFGTKYQDYLYSEKYTPQANN